jgi:NDP-sugar pyrophosphorylase family protein
MIFAKNESMRAMLFAAGLGTRLQAITGDKPKALVEISGKPLLEHAILYLKSFGIREVVVNVHHFADQIIEFLQGKNNFGIHVQISDERDCLLETGGGLKKAAPLFPGNEPVVLYNVDILSSLDLNRLLSYHLAGKALATLVVRKRVTSRYLLFDRQLQLSGWKNIRSGETKICRPDPLNDPEEFAFSGIHIIDPKLFSLITEDGRFSIIDLYLRLAQNQSIRAFLDDSEIWFDLGKPEQLAEAGKMLKKLQEK